MVIITPLEAFRLLFFAIGPEAASVFANKITHDGYFLFPTSMGTPDSAEVALKALCKYIKEGKIRLQSRSQIPPVDIDPIDCSLGVLDVFNQTLEIPAQSAAPARIYKHVFCVKDDIMKIVREIASNGNLTLASEKEIRDQIAAVYDNAATMGTKPPNINELPDAVQPRLKEAGHEASGRQIKKIGDEPQFKLRRLPAGQQSA